MEPSYWRNRLEEMNLRQRSLLVVPRPDLSSAAVEVAEIRMRTHDGIRLWGMMGRCTLGTKPLPARIRMVGPGESVEVDRGAICEGFCDLVIQEPAGRRLEDRVLDVMRACQTASDLDHVDSTRVSFEFGGEEAKPDEFHIASHLMSEIK